MGLTCPGARPTAGSVGHEIRHVCYWSFRIFFSRWSIVYQNTYRDLVNYFYTSWWRHQMVSFSTVYSGTDQRKHQSSASLDFVQGIRRWPVNSPHKWPVTRSFDVFFDLNLNKRLSKQGWCWWLETPSCPLWRHCNDKEWGWYVCDLRHLLIVTS